MQVLNHKVILTQGFLDKLLKNCIKTYLKCLKIASFWIIKSKNMQREALPHPPAIASRLTFCDDFGGT